MLTQNVRPSELRSRRDEAVIELATARDLKQFLNYLGIQRAATLLPTGLVDEIRKAPVEHMGISPRVRNDFAYELLWELFPDLMKQKVRGTWRDQSYRRDLMQLLEDQMVQGITQGALLTAIRHVATSVDHRICIAHQDAMRLGATIPPAVYRRTAA